MFPNLWIFDSYTLLIFIGVICCLLIYYIFALKHNIKGKYLYDILINATLSVIVGFVFAVLFQSIFDAFKENSENSPFAMTFYGGLIGGVLFFILFYKFYIQKKNENANFVKDILIIAPACITTAHAFGRIGCFLAGCCHGIETDSVLGMKFPGLEYNVYPTQLYEAIFLFILSGILFVLAYKFQYFYTFTIYLASYGIFRFLIEFIRGDDRGAFLFSLSPAQWISIIAIIISILYFVLFKRYLKNKSI